MRAEASPDGATPSRREACAGDGPSMTFVVASSMRLRPPDAWLGTPPRPPRWCTRDPTGVACAAPRLLRSDRQQDGVARAAAAAQRGGAETPTAALELVQQREGHAGAGHAHGMAEGDGATVDVDDVVGD